MDGVPGIPLFSTEHQYTSRPQPLFEAAPELLKFGKGLCRVPFEGLYRDYVWVM